MNVSFLFVGVLMATIGGWLVRRFSARARQSGIGSFQLVPWAGFGYLAGVLLILLGAFWVLLGLAA